MIFTKRLRDGVRRGTITCSVRIWTRPHVKAGGRYRMDEGEIEVDSIEPIEFSDITSALARKSGFSSVADLLAIAKHGRGENIYLVRFHYVPPGRRSPPRKVASRASRSPTPLAVSAHFRAFVLDQLEELGDVVPRSMFGGVGLYRRGLFFGILAGDVLYLKADDVTRPEFEAAGSKPFKPYSNRSGTMSYYSVPAGVLESALELARWGRLAIAAASRPSGRPRARSVRS